MLVFNFKICNTKNESLFRSIKLEYHKKIVKHGVEGNMYIAADKTLDNGQKLPENKCFCGSPSEESCLPAGAMNVSKCKYGAPAFVSLPHFYRADKYYINKLDMPPANSLEDDLFIALEPVTKVAT
jgi:scavenger receptor class B, member 1